MEIAIKLRCLFPYASPPCTHCTHNALGDYEQTMNSENHRLTPILRQSLSINTDLYNENHLLLWRMLMLSVDKSIFYRWCYDVAVTVITASLLHFSSCEITLCCHLFHSRCNGFTALIGRYEHISNEIDHSHYHCLI